MDLKLLPNNAMTFTENQHGNAVLEKLRQQRELVRCCDVILYVNEAKFHAHRCVLSACSPFFDSIFKASKTVKEQLRISAENSEVFQILLAYIYTGTVMVDKMNVSELLKLANKLLLIKLKDYCAEYLQRYLDTENCLTVLEMANKYCLESLQKITNSHIANHVMEVIEGEEILDLSFMKLENFVKNSNWSLSNEEILSLITSWVYHKPEEREGSFRSLLTLISWQDINPEQVVKNIQDHPLFSLSPKCREFILDVLCENNLLCQSLVDMKSRGIENGNYDEENEKFITIAISTAISESFLNEMDTGRELLRVELPPTDQQQQSTYEGRDFNQSKIGSNCDLDQYLYASNNSSNNNNNGNNNNTNNSNTGQVKNLPSRSSALPSTSNYSQNIDIEELCKYTIENTQKLNKPQVSEGCDDEPSHHGLKYNDYGNIMYNEPNCYHYRDYREGDHFNVQNADKCPKMTNKVAYMNHKHDANYSNQLTFNDLNYQKNIPLSSEFNPSAFQLDLCKDNALNLVGSSYPDDHSSFSQEARPHPNCPLTSSSYKKDFVMMNDNGLPEIPNNSFQSTILENNDNINSFVISSSQQDFFYMGYSDDTQGSNNCPQDMTLPHLKFGDCKSALVIEDKCCKMQSEVYSDQRTEDTPVEMENRSTPFVSRSDGSDNVINQELLLPRTSESDRTRSDWCELKESDKNQLESNVESNLNDAPVAATPDEVLKSKIPEKKSRIKRITKKLASNNGNSVRKKPPRVKNNSTKKNKAKEPSSNHKKGNGGNVVIKVCDVCDKVFDRSKEYFVHMTEHFPGPPFRCTLCKYTFKRIYYLLDHRNTHSSEKPLKCPDCSFSSRKQCNLRDHMLSHLAEKPFKCEECGESFVRKQHLIVHRTKHTDERPLVCDTCGWTAKTRNSLLFHTKTHTGDVYSCQYEGCTYKTPKRYHLKEHMQLHSKSRPFACKLCDKRFILKSHFQRHMSQHNNQRSFQCSSCDYFTSRSDLLKGHIKRKHLEFKPNPKTKRKSKEMEKKMIISNNEVNEEINGEHRLGEETREGKGVSTKATLLSLHHSTTSESPTSYCNFGTPGEPDDPLTIVSEIEDDNQSLTSFHQNSYLDPHIGQAFSGLLESSCEPGRFTLNSHEDLLL